MNLVPPDRSRRAVGIGLRFLLLAIFLFAGCARDTQWPPLPRTAKEREVIQAAERAVYQIDGWNEAACVVERSGRNWQVRAWKIVHPQAEGRNKCVPWAVRSITVDEAGKVIAYTNGS
jgi:hypothetical protein